jgi:DNA-binding transcriptional MerR regulator
MLISNDMTIGKLAAATRCTIPTIRYYEEIGLLPKANRRMSKHRVYGHADLRRLTFIRHCRDFGFPIKQIRELVELVGSPERDCTAARDLAAVHLIEVGRKLKELRALERSLKRFVEDLHRPMRGRTGARMHYSCRSCHSAAAMLRSPKSIGYGLLLTGAAKSCQKSKCWRDG